MTTYPEPLPGRATARLDGKVALVTGAARGQGRSHAVHAAQEGADIIAVDICAQVDTVPYPLATRADLEETERLVEKTGARVVAVEADVRDRTGLRAAVDAAVEELGRLDLVCANAGISVPAGLLDTDPAAWRDTIATNVTGAFHTLQVAVPHIVAGGRGGSVVLTSSASTLRPFWNLAAYMASKHAIVGLTAAAALELAPLSIRVNSVHPGTVYTPMVDNAFTHRLFVPDADEPTTEQIAAVTRTLHAMPVPWVDSSDVSLAVMYLFSDEARYVTGVQLPVDAGCSLL